MKSLILTLFLFAMSAQAGWRVVNGTPRTESWRFEDIYFTDEHNGWLVNMSGEIFNTTDGGENWSLQAKLPATLRSVDFINPQVGIVGSISNHSVYRTEDGGKTWNIVDPSNSFFEGVCGIAHIGNTYYASGRFSNGSFFYKSTDAGKTWTKKSLSHLANSLVDTYFFSEKEGFITGHGVGPNQGAVLLKTTDGGETWTTHYQSNEAADYHVWKFEKITEKFMVGSIWSNDNSENNGAYMIRSHDGGQTFTRHQVSPRYFYVEGIGFYNEKLGWMGGGEGLWETQDGGDTWSHINVGANINRFFRVGKKLYAVGKQVHVYEP